MYHRQAVWAAVVQGALGPAPMRQEIFPDLSEAAIPSSGLLPGELLRASIKSQVCSALMLWIPEQAQIAMLSPLNRIMLHWQGVGATSAARAL